MSISDFTPNGVLTLFFDSSIKLLPDLSKTLTLPKLNQIKDTILYLNYTTSFANLTSPSLPKLRSWEFSSFNDTRQITLKLNFSNSLYVSSEGIDYLDIIV